MLHACSDGPGHALDLLDFRLGDIIPELGPIPEPGHALTQKPALFGSGQQKRYFEPEIYEGVFVGAELGHELPELFAGQRCVALEPIYVETGQLSDFLLGHRRAFYGSEDDLWQDELLIYRFQREEVFFPVQHVADVQDEEQSPRRYAAQSQLVEAFEQPLFLELQESLLVL